MAEAKSESPLIDPSVIKDTKSGTAPKPTKKTKSRTADGGKYVWGTGRRKRSVARVRIKLGDG